MFPKIIKLSILFILLLAGYNTIYASFTISRPSTHNLGLVGYWTFDGKNVVNGVALDSSGNGNNGNLINIASSTFYSIGKIGQGFNFDGVNDYASTTRINNNEITVAGWYYKNANDFVANTADTVFGAWYWNANTQLQEGFDLRGGQFPLAGGCPASEGYLCAAFSVASTNGTTKTQKTSVFNVGSISKNGTSTQEWFHIAGTYTQSDGKQRLYINGVLRDTDLHTAGNTVVPLATTTTACFQKMNIGYGCVNNGWFNGKIDDVRLYNRALTANEVKNLYNQSASKFNKTPTNILTSGLVGHWTFDGADTNWTANTTADRSTSGNTGAMTNMSTTTSPAIGKIGQGLSFDGTDDYVDVGNKNIIDGGTAASICFWMKYNPSSVTVDGAIVSKWASSGGWVIWVDDVDILGSGKTNTISFAVNVGVGANGRVVGNTGLIASGAWEHYCGTFQGGSFIRLYKNGILDNQNNTNIIATVVSTAQPIYFANSADASLIKYLNANLDDVRIYNRTLSGAEVKMLYNMGR